MCPVRILEAFFYPFFFFKKNNYLILNYTAKLKTKNKKSYRHHLSTIHWEGHSQYIIIFYLMVIQIHLK